MKIGAVSGLIAGLVFEAVSEIVSPILLSIGLWETWFRPLIMNNTAINIPLFAFWGVVLGIIYSRVYSLVPGEGIWKSLVWGLFLWFIVEFRIQTFMIPYGAILNAVSGIFWGIFVYIAYGFSLGLLYKFLNDRHYPAREEPRIVSYDMKGGIQPGAIAGLLGGVAAGVVAVMGHVTGYWGVITAGKIVPTIGFWWSQFGVHVLMNMIWGTVFATIFPKVYNLVPGRRIGKGLYYGLIMYFITTFQITTWGTCWYAYHNASSLAITNMLSLSFSAANAVVFGLVLGALYKR